MPIEFPVTVPYTTTPRMVRNTGSVFAREPRSHYIRQKNIELARYGNDLWAQMPESSQLIQQATKDLGLVETSNIVNFALQIEEDVAVVHQGRLVAIAFCFPSSWIPSERIGQDLAQIHAPVADGDQLRKMSLRIAETMADPKQGSFKRHVWTIANSGELSQHPLNKNNSVPETIEDLWFRLETQTTFALGDGVTSLFFVRVETEPLKVFWENADQQQTLMASLNSMTDAVLTYKNLHYIKNFLEKK